MTSAMVEDDVSRTLVDLKRDHVMWLRGETSVDMRNQYAPAIRSFGRNLEFSSSSNVNTTSSPECSKAVAAVAASDHTELDALANVRRRGSCGGSFGCTRMFWDSGGVSRSAQEDIVSWQLNGPRGHHGVRVKGHATKTDVHEGRATEWQR